MDTDRLRWELEKIADRIDRINRMKAGIKPLSPMRIFDKLLGRKRPPRVNQKSEQAVLVYLRTHGLPAHVYKECDLGTIGGRLREVIKREHLGLFDGNGIGPDEAILYMYGPDAERLFAGVEGTLRAYPLCQGARVVIRRGGHGAEQRELIL
jgi:hypothetical protein